MTTTPPTPEELTIALLDIREQIAACHKQEGKEDRATTLRHKAMDAAAAFVDPDGESE